jgi:ribosomal protein S18 acetylase RimI-like enzyme
VIREAAVAEAGEIRRVHARSWLATYPNEDYGVTRQWVEEFTESWLTVQALAQSAEFIAQVIAAPDTFYRVAEVGGRIAGFVHAAKRGPDDAEILGLYLDPPVIGVGVGRQLMDAAIGWVGPAAARLDVAPYNQRAIAFYRRYGFAEVPGSARLLNVLPWTTPDGRADAPAGLAVGVNAIPAITMARDRAGSAGLPATMAAGLGGR